MTRLEVKTNKGSARLTERLRGSESEERKTIVFALFSKRKLGEQIIGYLPSWQLKLSTRSSSHCKWVSSRRIPFVYLWFFGLRNERGQMSHSWWYQRIEWPRFSHHSYAIIVQILIIHIMGPQHGCSHFSSLFSRTKQATFFYD